MLSFLIISIIQLVLLSFVVEAWIFVPPSSTTTKIAQQQPKWSTALPSGVGDACGLTYEEPVFRPPAEWRSLILQVTIGCSWNKCTFCEMYQDKEFRARPLSELEDELQRVVRAGGAPHVRDVFLADGDAMTLPTARLVEILELIRRYLPKARRISSYCLPRNIRHTSVEDLARLKNLGLSLVYVGCESGDNQVLQAIEKGETFDTSLAALQKLQQAGIKRSIMILLGLAGKGELSDSHAKESARLCSESEPEFLSVLTTSFPRGKQRVQDGYQKHLVDHYNSSSSFEELNARESLQELYLFLSQIELSRNQKTVFRSDHASNYLVLKGRLGRDKERLLGELKEVLDSPPTQDSLNLRPEWARGL
jgi:radical SAM superfamily enzyme YgiQ (UPF0313 family)